MLPHVTEQGSVKLQVSGIKMTEVAAAAAAAAAIRRRMEMMDMEWTRLHCQLNVFHIALLDINMVLFRRKWFMDSTLTNVPVDN
jgi:uncharacterized membrane protein YgdD (TMEM256/DUF423 family)